MSHRIIPAELEPAITELVKEKKSLRVIADWLRSEHHLDVSHMAVHRLVERLRFAAFGVPDTDADLAEAQSQVGSMLRTLKALSEQFGEAAERALHGDAAAKIEADPKLAQQLFAKQAQFIRDWFRYLDRHLKSREVEWTGFRESARNLESYMDQNGTDAERAQLKASRRKRLERDVRRRASTLSWGTALDAA